MTNKFLASFRLLLALAVGASATGPYLTQPEAIDFNAELIDTYKFTLEQLTELAGFSAASAIEHVYPARGPVLVVCGPGNNGGDGLACARHLKAFGYSPFIYYPFPSKTPAHQNLVHQLEKMNITLLRKLPKVKRMNYDYKLVVDAVFGVRFKSHKRPPDKFVQILDNMLESVTPVASIDVPSGWHVEMGPNLDTIRPEFLISIGAPKQCAKFFEGKHHFLGGRFVPPALLEKYGVSLPPYLRDESFVKLNCGER